MTRLELCEFSIQLAIIGRHASWHDGNPASTRFYLHAADFDARRLDSTHRARNVALFEGTGFAAHDMPPLFWFE
jgi:hypothetical protein